jgi:5-methylcytosine-specific restriction endonuclease McrA
MKPTPEKLRESKRRDYERHKEAYKARAMARHKANRPAILEKMREYGKSHKAETNEWRRNRYWSDPEKYRAIKREEAREAYWRNRDKSLQRTKAWQKKNRWYINYQKRERKVRLSMAFTDGSAKEFYKWVRSQAIINCAYCQNPVSGKDAHIDHKIAISKGGAHVQSNLEASCASCNLRKGTLTPEEFIKRKGEVNFYA